MKNSERVKLKLILKKGSSVKALSCSLHYNSLKYFMYALASYKYEVRSCQISKINNI